jgi:adenylosuccinate synthase
MFPPSFPSLKILSLRVSPLRIRLKWGFYSDTQCTFSASIGLNADGRLFVSDRAHLVFDFHQKIDGLKEVELGRGSIGTTGKGIGPTYSSKASRSGLRVHHLYNFEEFSTKFRTMVINKMKRYGQFEYDVEAEIERYKVRQQSRFSILQPRGKERC